VSSPGTDDQSRRATQPSRGSTPNRAAQPDRASEPSRSPLGRFDPQSWTGALAIMAVTAGALWTIEIFNVVNDYSFNRFGLKPRQVDGLIGIVSMPFLHNGVGHLLANTIPFVMIGWLVLIGGVADFLRATAIIVLGGGLATWLVAPSGTIVGASALIFGWLGYLLGRAYFARKFGWIVAAAFALFFFASLFSGLLPSVNSAVSWQAHLCGFGAGIAAAWVLHPRKGSARAARRAVGRPS
jgi:membrane associated rhomboid family serine protease